MKCLVNFNSLCHSRPFWWQNTFNSPRGESQSPSSYHIQFEAQDLWIITAGWSLRESQVWLFIGWHTYDVTYPSSSIPTPTLNGDRTISVTFPFRKRDLLLSLVSNNSEIRLCSHCEGFPFQGEECSLIWPWYWATGRALPLGVFHGYQFFILLGQV